MARQIDITSEMARTVVLSRTVRKYISVTIAFSYELKTIVRVRPMKSDNLSLRGARGNLRFRDFTCFLNERRNKIVSRHGQ